MTAGRTADARLHRLLHVLPAASREGGALLVDLARALDVGEAHILDDLEEVTARSYYHPGGWPDDVRILIEAGRVRVERPGGFSRPVKLSSAETLCLALALRGTAATAFVADAEARSLLLARAEEALSYRDEAHRDGTLDAPDRVPDAEGYRELLIRAARERRACAIHYVKSSASDGSVRVIHPYTVFHAEGHWYAVAHCVLEDDVRLFRLDRVLAADVTDATFAVPDDFHLEAYVSDGKAYHAADDRPVRVRYSKRIARWVRERAEWHTEEVETLDDGSVVLELRVADPTWAVMQALQYGAEAEILEPAEMRALVCRVAGALAADGSAD